MKSKTCYQSSDSEKHGGFYFFNFARVLISENVVFVNLRFVDPVGWEVGCECCG